MSESTNHSLPLIVHVSTPVSWRGGEQQIAYLVQELAKKNVDQLIVCPIGSSLERYCQKNKYAVDSYSRGLGFVLKLSSKLGVISRNNSHAIIHVHDAHAHSSAVLSSIILNNKSDIILSRRIDIPIRKNKLSLAKYNHTRIKKILCVSDCIRRMIEPDIKNKSKLETIHDGVDSNRSFITTNYLRNRYNLKTNTILVGNVSALYESKDYYTFIDTADILIKSNLNIKFFIVGDGPERQSIINYIRHKNLTEDVLLTGFLDNVREVLAELDVFLFTPIKEGLGTTLLDAYCAKVPVVCTDAGGVTEIVENNKTGLVSEVKDAASLAQNVKKLVDNRELKEKLVQNSSARLMKFTKEIMADKTLTIYTALTR